MRLARRRNGLRSFGLAMLLFAGLVVAVPLLLVGIGLAS